MPIIKSAKKRVKTAQKAAVRNSKTKRTLRESIKAFNSAVTGGNKQQIEKTYTEAIKAIDTAAKKNIMHKNKAARKKSQLSATAKQAGYKPLPKSLKKAPAKTPSAKPKAVKKPTAKKAPTKKPAK